MRIVGKTQDGKSVVAGIGRLYFETGIPLSVMFDVLRQKGYVIAWPELIHELEQNGMKRDRIIHLLNEHIFESFGKEYRDHVIQKLS